MPFSHLLEFQQLRDFNQKINASFGFLRAHFRPLLRGMLAYVLPVPVLLVVLTFGAGYAARGALSGDNSAWGGFFLLALWGLLLLLAWACLLGVVYGYLVLRMDAPPAQAVTVRQLGHYLQEHLWRILWGQVVILLVLGLCSLLCLVPAIWFWPIAALASFVQQREACGADRALTRATELLKGEWWPTFGLLLVAALLMYVLTLPLLGVNMLVLFVFQLAHLAGAWQIWPTILLQVLFTVVVGCLLIVPLTVAAFQYFHLVELRESRGAYALLAELGQAGPVARPPAPDWHPTGLPDEDEY